jgi:hypothetical protein
MSALAMILTAAMAVPGDRPEKESGEMVRQRQPLNLDGQWKAVVYWRGRVIKGQAGVGVDGRFQRKLRYTGVPRDFPRTDKR